MIDLFNMLLILMYMIIGVYTMQPVFLVIGFIFIQISMLGGEK